MSLKGASESELLCRTVTPISFLLGDESHAANLVASLRSFQVGMDEAADTVPCIVHRARKKICHAAISIWVCLSQKSWLPVQSLRYAEC